MADDPKPPLNGEAKCNEIVSDLTGNVTNYLIAPLTHRRENTDDPRSPWVITVALEHESHNVFIRPHTKGFSRLTPDQMQAVREAAKEIEQSCNVKFKFLYHFDEREHANIRMSQGKAMEGAGVTNMGLGASRDILINETKKLSWFDYQAGNKGYQIVLHEMLHAMGFEHPARDGLNPKYTSDDTMMSYNKSNRTSHLRDGDKAALRSYYGDPQPAAMSAEMQRALAQAKTPSYTPSARTDESHRATGLELSQRVAAKLPSAS